MNDPRTWLTPKEVAAMLRVTPATVRKWCDRGLIAADTTPGGHRRFRLGDVEGLARRHGIDLARPDDPALRVLVAEDDSTFAAYVAELIAGLSGPVELEVAANGFDAGIRARELTPDLMLLDLNLPGLDGLTVCRTIRADPALARTRVIAMSAFITPDSRASLLHAGADAVFEKPIDEHALLATVRVLTGRAHVDGDGAMREGM